MRKDGRLVVAFDVDDTLIVPSVAMRAKSGVVMSGPGRDTPNYENVAAYKWFQRQGCYMIIWSGSGLDWAKTWAEKLGLTADEFPAKQKRQDVDIAIDDCVVDLGRVNARVKRINNQISRREWNKKDGR